MDHDERFENTPLLFILSSRHRVMWCDILVFSISFGFRLKDEELETIQISEETVNPIDEKIGPESFELLKVLGKGGYGKVSRDTICISWLLLHEKRMRQYELNVSVFVMFSRDFIVKMVVSILRCSKLRRLQDITKTIYTQ